MAASKQDFLAKYGAMLEASTPVPEERAAELQPESLLQRSTRRAGQELLSAPGAPAGLYGLARAAIDRYINGVPWEDAFLSEEGRALVDRVQEEGPVGDLARMALEKNPTQVLRPGLRTAAEWYTWGGDVTGVTDSEDGSVPLDEEVGGIALSTLVTLPASIISKPASLIGNLSNRTARVGLTGALRAAELMTPATIGAGPYGSNIAANAAVQIALNDVARGLMEEQTLTGTVLGQDYEEEIGQATAGEPISGAGEVAATLGGAAAVTAAGLAGGRVIKRIADDAAQKSGQLTNTDPATMGWMERRDSAGNTIRDAVQDINTAVFDEQNILSEALIRTGRDKDRVETFDDFLRAVSGNSGTQAINRAYTTGVIDADGSIKTRVAPAQLFDAYDRLDTQTQKKVNDAITALDELQRRQRGVINFTSITDAQLRRTSRTLMRDPVVRKMVDDYFDIGQKLSDYRLKHGMIGRTQYAAEAHGNYMPNLPMPEPRKGLAGFLDKYMPGRSRVSLNTTRADFEKAARGGMEAKMPAMDAMKEYIGVQMREVNNNRVRRAFLRQMVGRPMTDFAAGRRLVSTRPDDGGTLIEVMDGDRVRKYYVGDPRIAKALQFRPSAIAPFGLNTTRRWFQQTTTGNLAPMFAPVSLAYDAMVGLLGARASRVVSGPLDDALKRAGLSNQARENLALLRPIDTVMLVGEGLIHGFAGRVKEEFAMRMIKRAAATGSPVHQAAAHAAADAYIRSRYGTMHMQGYTSNMITEGLRDADIVDAALSKLRNAPGVRWYVGALDTIRDAYRMGLFARNVSHQKWLNDRMYGRPDVTKTQYRKIVNHVREVSVDPSKRGSSDFVNQLTSAIPYANIMLHSASHLVRNMMMNRGGRIAWISMVGYALAARYMMSPEAREYHDQRTPEYKRGTHFVFELPHEGEPFDAEKHLRYMPIGPEMGLLVNGTVEALNAWFDAEGEETGDPTLGDRLRHAVLEIVNVPIPPMVQAGLSASGYGRFDPAGMMRGDSAFRSPMIEGGVPEMRGVGFDDGVITDRVHGMIEALFGSFGRTIMDAAEVVDQEVAKPDAQFAEAMDQALDVVKYGMFDVQKVGTLFTDTVIAKPRGTPLSSKAYEIRNMLEEAVEFARDLTPNFSEGARDADIPYDQAVTVLPDHLEDPALQQQAMLIQSFFSTAGVADSLRNAAQLRLSYFRTKSNTSVPLSRKNEVLNAINEEMHANFETMVQSYGDFERKMQQMTGDPEWSVEKFLRAAREDIYAD